MQKHLYTIALFLFATFTCFQGKADGKYWVFLTNKKEVTFDPYTYFHPKAIERRIKNHVSLYDSTDFALNSHYVQSITHLVDSVKTELRWLNAMVVYGTDDQLEAVRHLPYVKEVVPAMHYIPTLAAVYEDSPTNETLNENEKALLTLQTKRMTGEIFAEKEIDGKGVRVAIFDAGFPEGDTHPTLKHIRDDNRIIKTFDFVTNKDYVYHANGHGLATFSCVGGIYEGIPIGLAPGADFLLARTERAHREPFSEEEYWMKAAEWADQNGADIISSSLGYSGHRYFYEDMNGTSYIAQVAKKAYEKGILVVNSMGNEGTNDWRFVITPADIDEVMSVGGTDPNTGYHTNFSSYGPTSDYRMKPNVAALGHVMAAAKDGQLKRTQGTSFSCPLVAGFAACVLQANPSLTVSELFTKIEESCDLHPYYDYAHGFGVPQASDLFYASRPAKTFTTEVKKERVTIEVEPSYVQLAGQIAEDELFEGYQKYLYYHIENANGYLSDYYVLLPGEEPIVINRIHFPNAKAIRVHFYGYTEEIPLD